MTNIKTGFAEINGAKLYYQLAGEGQPFVMIHAGISDHRMWKNEFDTYAKKYQVLSFDMRGYGKSEPVEGKFNIQDDFESLLDALDINTPMILMGCSIGAGLAMDFTLTYPDRVHSLILIGGAPRGIELEMLGLEVEEPVALFEQAEKAFEANNLDLATELDMQIWFDGMGRSKDDVNAEVRQLAYDINRIVIGYEAKDIGEHIRKEFDKPAVERLDELTLPTLIIVGENDIPFIVASADYMEDHILNAIKAIIPNSAHLPNMEHPHIFQEIIDTFLTS
jgi:pimeloyl-ACP methyl ester carboxylesterase